MATGHAGTDMKMCYKQYSIHHICSLNLASSILLCISDEVPEQELTFYKHVESTSPFSVEWLNQLEP